MLEKITFVLSSGTAHTTKRFNAGVTVQMEGLDTEAKTIVELALVPLMEWVTTYLMLD